MYPKLPSLIEERLAEDLNLRSAVDLVLSETATLLHHSHVPFFPDYTDHGLQHVVRVLDTAAALIPEPARTLVTAGDMAVLSISAFLHDIAMHVTEAMFWELITSESWGRQIIYFNDVPWPTAWERFFFAARRWDEDKLSNIFGPASLSGSASPIANPLDHYGNLTLRDRQLIGEFIRLNHARMAHEFAVCGLPGGAPNAWRLPEIFGDDLTDIAGTVARSHWLPLRFAWEYTAQKYHRREYKGVHAAFVMSVLRIADFVQIQADRAPSLVFQYKRILSPTSQVEWKAHQAVTNITQTHDDPESLDIATNPEDVHTYLRLKQWLGDFQAELDSCWAVLGEVYGSHPLLRNLGIILRRVRSNLDGTQFAASNSVYVPDRIEFQVQRPQLLKLLVRPLYGDKPEIGVRELLQNAVDAVRERWAFQERHEIAKHIPLRRQGADVVCRLSDPDSQGNSYLTIADTGVGMTPDVIKHYFLNVGASYRTSEAWQREFEESDDADTLESSVRSRVLRSGRFGIGVLAAFLLGNEIEVATRSIGAPVGVRFRSRLDSAPIQVNYDPDLQVGTVIGVRLSRLAVERLRRDADAHWDWYCLNRPSVRRIIGTEGSPLSQDYSLPNEIQTDLRGWRPLEVPGYSRVLWSYQRAPAITCNGLRVKRTTERPDYSRKLVGLANQNYLIRKPKISAFDPDGRYPLNLQRDRIVGPDPFAAKLWRDVLRDMLSYAIVQARQQLSPTTLHSIASYVGVELARHYNGYPEAGQWAITPDGLVVTEDWCLNMLDAHSILHLFRRETPFCPPLGSTWHDLTLVCNGGSFSTPSALDVVRELALRLPASQMLRLPKNRQIAGTRVCLASPLYKDFMEDNTSRYVNNSADKRQLQAELKRIRSGLEEAEECGGWILASTRGCPRSLFDPRGLVSVLPPHKYSFAIELFSGPEEVQEQEGSFYMRRRRKKSAAPAEVRADRRSELERLWVELLARPTIPLGIERQSLQIDRALRELDEMISAHAFMVGKRLEVAER
jgi:molecular chaperone HtpG